MPNFTIRFLKQAWRPIMALVLVFILFLYLVVGFFLYLYKIPYPELPDGAWALLSVFAGSYTLSRGAEKFSTNWSYGHMNDDRRKNSKKKFLEESDDIIEDFED